MSESSGDDNNDDNEDDERSGTWDLLIFIIQINIPTERIIFISLSDSKRKHFHINKKILFGNKNSKLSQPPTVLFCALIQNELFSSFLSLLFYWSSSCRCPFFRSFALDFLFVFSRLWMDLFLCFLISLHNLRTSFRLCLARMCLNLVLISSFLITHTF